MSNLLWPSGKLILQIGIGILFWLEEKYIILVIRSFEINWFKKNK